MRKNHFGFIEAIGSVILVLLDPVRTNNKKYLNKKYNTLNRIVGFITLLLSIIIILYFLMNYINKHD